MKKIFFLSIFLLLLSLNQSAQTQDNRPAPPKMKSPAELAKAKSDMMQAELSLDPRQYKKVYNLFKKDFEYRQQSAKSAFSGGMPPMGGGMQGGGPGGMGGPGMGGGMQGGGPGGMGGPGMGGGMQGGGPGGMGGPGMGGPGEEMVTEEYLEKQDKKLRKILSPAQYERWRAKHPMEHLELPPIEDNGKHIL